MPTKTMKCGCRWDGLVLARCGRHREAGSLAADLARERDPVKTAPLVKVTDLHARVGDIPAWICENMIRHALGLAPSLFDVYDAVDALLGVWDQLPPSMRSRICDYIYVAIRRGSAGCPRAVERWERLLAWEEGILSSREQVVTKHGRVARGELPTEQCLECMSTKVETKGTDLIIDKRFYECRACGCEWYSTPQPSALAEPVLV